MKRNFVFALTLYITTSTFIMPASLFRPDAPQIKNSREFQELARLESAQLESEDNIIENAL